MARFKRTWEEYRKSEDYAINRKHMETKTHGPNKYPGACIHCKAPIAAYAGKLAYHGTTRGVACISPVSCRDRMLSGAWTLPEAELEKKYRDPITDKILRYSVLVPDRPDLLSKIEQLYQWYSTMNVRLLAQLIVDMSKIHRLPDTNRANVLDDDLTVKYPTPPTVNGSELTRAIEIAATADIQDPKEVNAYTYAIHDWVNGKTNRPPKKPS